MSRPENMINSIGAVAEFAQQLRLLRQHAALSLRQLAASTGLSTATLSVAAAGQNCPPGKSPKGTFGPATGTWMTGEFAGNTLASLPDSFLPRCPTAECYVRQADDPGERPFAGRSGAFARDGRDGL